MSTEDKGRKDDNHRRAQVARAAGEANTREIERLTTLRIQGKIDVGGKADGLVAMGADTSRTFFQTAQRIRDSYERQGRAVPAYLQKVTDYAKRFGETARAATDLDGREQVALAVKSRKEIVATPAEPVSRDARRPDRTTPGIAPG